MGANLVRRWMAPGGHSAVVFDRDPSAVQPLLHLGAVSSVSLEDMAHKLEPPRAVWVMLPAGPATETTIADLAEVLSPGDVVIDGGNTHWRDDIRRAKTLQTSGIHYVDVGTSGGVWGLTRGYCLMVGGTAEVVIRLDPIFATLAPGNPEIDQGVGAVARDTRIQRGYIHAGPSGSGHFLKMVHNGIEYGMMQAYAEGFDLLKSASDPALAPEERFDFDLADVAHVWRRGSVISSWLLDLTANALDEDEELSLYSGAVGDSGEGRWTIETAIARGVPAPVLTAALFTRFRSRRQHTFAEKLVSAMRDQFGGHKEPGRKAP
jgi:6-phosphogluconate dehydrogenase